MNWRYGSGCEVDRLSIPVGLSIRIGTTDMTAPSLLNPSLRCLAGSITHPGLVRRENEDALALRPAQGLWAVADGMGGHANGRWAAEEVVRALEQAPLDRTVDPDCAAIGAVVGDANRMILARAAGSGRTIGATLAVLRIVGRRFACLWAGDSRVYRLRGGGIEQLTRDHSHVQQLVDAGLISVEEAARHPMGNVITRAVGVSPDFSLDNVEGAADVGDSFLLCSDGLTRCLSDRELATIAAEGDPQQACERMLAMTLARGAPDNVSIVLVRCAAG
ncbi:MAG: Protein serine/threonine phosphatase PrpC, regulation of stationary phase [Sphingomonas bacterium]|nr:Protein serine/threonine phosphatase PrpC, regulation of stationary phase [Sphingomonas bacterium]